MRLAGAKAGLIRGGEVLTIQRDDLAGLAWAGMWDLPGGGAEPGETAEDCLLREIEEELGLRLAPERLRFRAEHPALRRPGAVGVFFLAAITAAEVAAVRFGDEGQGWRMMAVADYLAHPQAVPGMQERLAAALRAAPGWDR